MRASNLCKRLCPDMRAALVEAMDRLPAITDIAAPVRGEGQVLIEVTAAALNPVELHIWRGRFRDGPPRTPYVPGVEGVGRVVEGGGLEPGTRVRFEVVGLHPGYGTDGAMAELALADEPIVSPLPDDVPDALAAALGAGHIVASPSGIPMIVKVCQHARDHVPDRQPPPGEDEPDRPRQERVTRVSLTRRADLMGRAAGGTGA